MKKGVSFKVRVSYFMVGWAFIGIIFNRRSLRVNARGILLLGILFIPLLNVYAQNNSVSANLTNEETNWINDHPVIRVSNFTKWPPIEYISEGSPAGFSVDYIKLIASKVGIKVEFISNDSWPKLLEMAENKEIDVLLSMLEKKKGDIDWYYSSPYFNMPMIFYGTIGADKIGGINDLINKKIGVVKDWPSEKIFKENYKRLNLVIFDNIREALIALSAGNIDVFVSRQPNASYIIEKNFITNIDVIGTNILAESLYADELRFAVRKDWPILLSIIEKGMEQVSASEYMDLSSKWQTENIIDDQVGLNGAEREWLDNHHVIHLVSEKGLLPLIDIDEDNKVTGIAGAYLDLIAKRLNVRFQWIGNETREEGLSAINAGKADIILSSGAILKPQENLNFTDNYVVFSEMIFSKKSGPGFINMASLKNKKVAQIKNYAVSDEIRNEFPDIEVVEVDDVSSALKLLNDGMVDAYIGIIPLTSRIIALEGYKDIVVSGETPMKSSYSFGIRNDLDLLGSSMQKALNSITAGEKAAFSRNWLSIKVERDQTNLILNIFVVVFALLLILFIWMNSLRREISRRKIIEGELIKSQKEAETAMAAKSTFLANMSHEIRTPLNAIIGFSDVITSETFGRVSQRKYREYLKDIKWSGEHLSVVINDILDLSKIEAGKWHMTDIDFDLLRTVEECIKPYCQKAKERNLSINININNEDREVALLADESCIRRIIDNLISNSVKFTADGGKIDINIKREPVGSLTIEVIDNGVGIAEDRLKVVLSPFGQAYELKNLNKGGTGLGLAIVNQLVTLHGGTFSVESKVGIGTKASANLPKERVIN
ncbi:MAG: transporter substrate-binding domain-containing protein [Kordiimonadaceae bacterium]|nr:transporter substrate-binding domain-containing protein [Kordiimonadaceae bacterium]